MPSQEDFLKGFNVDKPVKLGKYILEGADIEHNQIVRWNEYSYPTELLFIFDETKNGSLEPSENDIDDLFNQIGDYVVGVKIIRSQSGRPYESYFQWPIGTDGTGEISSDLKQVTFKFTGHAKRISEDRVNEINRM